MFDRERGYSKGVFILFIFIRVKVVIFLVFWFSVKVFVFLLLSISYLIDERNILNFKGYFGVILRSGDEFLGKVSKF